MKMLHTTAYLANTRLLGKYKDAAMEVSICKLLPLKNLILQTHKYKSEKLSCGKMHNADLLIFVVLDNMSTLKVCEGFQNPANVTFLEANVQQQTRTK